MKRHLLKTTILSFLLVFMSCDKDNDKIEVNNFKGYYKIESITSSLPIDLNNDGIKSRDYLKEIKSDYIKYDGNIINFDYDNNKRFNLAKAKPTQDEPISHQFLNIQFPIQSIDSLYLGNNTFVKMNFSYKKIVTYLSYTLSNNSIYIGPESSNDFEYYNIKNFTINRINSDIFEISFEFNVYDFTEKKWVETNLKAVYQKVDVESFPRFG